MNKILFIPIRIMCGIEISEKMQWFGDGKIQFLSRMFNGDWRLYETILMFLYKIKVFRKLLGALVKSLYRAYDKMSVACRTMWKIESPTRLMFIADIGSYPRSRPLQIKGMKICIWLCFVKTGMSWSIICCYAARWLLKYRGVTSVVLD